MKKIIPIIILAALGALVAWTFYKKHEVAARPYVEVSGTVEFEDVSVGSKEGGRVSEVLVKEGDEVKAGQVLIKLDSSALVAGLEEANAAAAMAQAKLDLLRNGYDPQDIEAARATADVADAQYDLLRNGYDREDITAARAGVAAQEQQSRLVHEGTRQEQVDAARANMDAAREQYANLKTMYERQRNMLDSGVVSQQTVDNARTAMESAGQAARAAEAMYDLARNGPRAEERRIADNQVTAGRANLAKLERGPRPEQKTAAAKQADAGHAQLKKLERGPRPEEIAQAQAALEQAQAHVRTIQTRLAEMQVVAPARCVVDTLDLNPGDIVGPGETIAKLVLKEKPWVRIFVPENDLNLLKQNEKIDLDIDSLPGEKFKGTITRIASKAEFTPRNVQTPEGRATQVFRTKIVIDDPNGKIRAGMTATVRLEK